MIELTFKRLLEVELQRLPEFKNRKGELAHSKPDGSDWSPSQWLQAVVGELGEYANLRKKYERGDIDANEFHREAAKELADVQCYLSLLAYHIDIDLGEATIQKFNEISDRIGSTIKL